MHKIIAHCSLYTLYHGQLPVSTEQNGIVRRFAKTPEVMAPFRHAVNVARRAGIPVIFVRVACREGYPEVSAKN